MLALYCQLSKCKHFSPFFLQNQPNFASISPNISWARGRNLLRITWHKKGERKQLCIGQYTQSHTHTPPATNTNWTHYSATKISHTRTHTPPPTTNTNWTHYSATKISHTHTHLLQQQTPTEHTIQQQKCRTAQVTELAHLTHHLNLLELERKSICQLCASGLCSNGFFYQSHTHTHLLQQQTPIEHTIQLNFPCVTEYTVYMFRAMTL